MNVEFEAKLRNAIWLLMSQSSSLSAVPTARKTLPAAMMLSANAVVGAAMKAEIVAATSSEAVRHADNSRCASRIERTAA